MKIIMRFAGAMWVLVLIAGGALPLAGHAQTTGTDRLKVSGATTITDYIQPWIPEFEAKNPTVGITLVGSSTGKSLQELRAGTTDVAMVAREITEQDKTEAMEAGVDLRRTFLAQGAVAFIVHPNNSVSELSFEELARIFGGKCRNWKEIGGPELSVVIVLPPQGFGGIGTVVSDMLKITFPSDSTIVSNFPTIVKVVERNSAAIAFVRPNLALKGNVKALAIRPGHGSEAVQLSRENIQAGKYPFTRPLLLCHDGNKNAHKESVQRFLDFCVAKAKETPPD